MDVLIKTLRALAKKHGLKIRKLSNGLGVFLYLMNTDKSLSTESSVFVENGNTKAFLEALDALRNDADFEPLHKEIKATKGLYLSI